jgi:hypothetical protein
MSPTPPPPSEPPSRPLRGGRIVAAGLIAGTGGLAIALFLRTIVANTPVRVSSYTLFWSTVLVGGFGVVAGMAVEAVRQLQESNPDPEYRRQHQARRRRGGRGGSP